MAHARAIGLDLRRFSTDFATGFTAEKVKRDFRSGLRSGVNGTPTFFIDGLRFDGHPDLPSLTLSIAAAARARGVDVVG